MTEYINGPTSVVTAVEGDLIQSASSRQEFVTKLRGDGLRVLPLTQSRLVGAVIAVYLALVLVASLHFNVSLTPDRVVILLAIAALGTGRVRQFLKDWSIFLIVLLAWQVLSGMSRNFGGLKPHVTEMIDFDRAIFFGQIPTVWLQQRFHHAGHYAAYNMLTQHRAWVSGPLSWYDIGATVLYLLHFVFPMVVAFILWVWKRPIFVEFMASFLVVALAGFATFVLFPAAPPWIASDWWHYFPRIDRILQDGIAYFGGEQSFSALYQWLWDHGGWDVYGAVPSEHAAFPFLCFLYLRRAWPRGGWAALPYCLAVWLAVVYLGEHYVADIVAGVVYAAAGYGVVQLFLRQRSARSVELASSEIEPGAVSDTLSA